MIGWGRGSAQTASTSRFSAVVRGADGRERDLVDTGGR